MQSVEFRHFAAVHNATGGKESDNNLGAREWNRQFVVTNTNKRGEHVRAGSAMYEIAGICSEVDI